MPRATRLLLALALAAGAAPARADWLEDSSKTAAETAIAGVPAREQPKEDWTSYAPPSRLFSAEIPSTGWRPMEEETARGLVVRLLGPDAPSGTIRATLTVRFFDKDSPSFTPLKQLVDVLRRPEPGRSAGPVRPLRVQLGLARTFEIVESRRLPLEEGPALDEELHHYVAVIPVGEAYYLVRLVSARSVYLDYRDLFVRFLKSMRATVGGR